MGMAASDKANGADVERLEEESITEQKGVSVLFMVWKF